MKRKSRIKRRNTKTRKNECISRNETLSAIKSNASRYECKTWHLKVEKVKVVFFVKVVRSKYTMDLSPFAANDKQQRKRKEKKT